MPNTNERVLTIEQPDNRAVVDFLSEPGRNDVTVEIAIERGKVRVVAKCMHGEEASTWDEHEVEWDLPKKEQEPETAYLPSRNQATDEPCTILCTKIDGEWTYLGDDNKRHVTTDRVYTDGYKAMQVAKARWGSRK